jgi:hypothetical protein
MRNRAGAGQTFPGLDVQSRRHVGIILRQVALVAVICLPMALASEDPLKNYLLLLRVTFGFSALVMTLTATMARARLSPTSLCVWDHGAALLLLKLGCSLALAGLA